MSFFVVTAAIFVTAAFACWLTVGRALGRRIEPISDSADDAASVR